MDYAVDIQFFQLSRCIFVPKELAACRMLLSEEKPTVYLFKPPVKKKKLSLQDKKSVDWLEQHYHKILFEAGDIPAKNIIKIIKKKLVNARKIFVKGLEKAEYLRSIGIKK